MTAPNRLLPTEPRHAGALRRTAVSHLGMRVPDVAALTEFYGRVLGLAPHRELPGGGMRLGWGTGHHVLDLLPGDPALDHFGFEVTEPGGLERLGERLRAAGVAVDRLDEAFLDESSGAPQGLAAVDPDGNRVHFHGPVRRAGEHAADTGRRPIRYQHLTLATTDVSRMVEFYCGAVGFRISDQLADGKFAWLRSNRDHHTLAVVAAGRPGLDHYSYDLAEWQDFKSWCDRLTEQEVDVVWGPGRHGPGNNLFVFFDDPAGNHVELSAEMEKFHDDRVTYPPRQWDPVPRSVNLWGGQLASWRSTSEGN
ncbi:VOC family protein [Nocardia wallacei]|uniref:VOC family protein n=1 Tax=Nocardia wallacei TaxID=480035 RepID=UPI0024554706|nr:VOC family protein [Nocardia wallacei]